MAIDWILVLAQSSAPPPPSAIAVAIGLFAVIVTAPLIMLNLYGDRRAARLLETWARASNLEIDSTKVASYHRGPYSARGKWTTVFRVTTRPSAGAPRTGYVCVNNVFVWGGVPEVRWDE